MSEDAEAQTRRNMGWYYMDALRHIAERGRWPAGLSAGERRRIREAGLVELVYIPMKGWKPILRGDEGIHNDNR